MILCIGTTPAAQRVMVFRKVVIDAVNRASTTLDGAAGKSINVAKVLRALGGHPVATGFLGGERGDYLREVLRGRGIDSDFVSVAVRTRQCITVIDEAAGTHTELVEESAAVPAAHYDELSRIISKRIAGCSAVVMSGTLTPGGPVDFYACCTQLAHGASALAVVDAQGPALLKALEAAPDLIKPNRAELAATVGRALADESAVMAAMRELAERGAAKVVVTSGKEASLAFDGRRFWKIAAPRVAAKNPIGSGDAFTAALVWRLVRGDGLGEACRWASAAGAANALTLMPGEVEREEVERLVRETAAEEIQQTC
jgi:1-phosphofructokinase family hexose kinase